MIFVKLKISILVIRRCYNLLHSLLKLKNLTVYHAFLIFKRLAIYLFYVSRNLSFFPFPEEVHLVLYSYVVLLCKLRLETDPILGPLIA